MSECLNKKSEYQTKSLSAKHLCLEFIKAYDVWISDHEFGFQHIIIYGCQSINLDFSLWCLDVRP